jgi:hypothetical protein
MRLALAGVCVSAVALLSCSAAAADPQPAERPVDGPIKLFNGKDLSGLYTWLRDARYEDPRQVFTAHDGILRISGDGLGYLCTEQSYRDYHLIIEFKWGERTWGDRKDRARDSGVLVHCHGPDGNYGGTWMASVEAQIIEGGVGDLLVLTGKDPDDGTPVPTSLAAQVEKDRDGETVWSPEGKQQTFTSGRINWFGRDPDWKDEVGFRGPQDVESPFGRWTRMDVICDGGSIVVKVNGVKVNEASEASPASGKILVQTELAETFVRRWELWPIGDAPEFDANSFSFDD